MAKRICTAVDVEALLGTVSHNDDGSKRTMQELVPFVKQINSELLGKGVTGFMPALKEYIASETNPLTSDESLKLDELTSKVLTAVMGGKSIFDPGVFDVVTFELIVTLLGKTSLRGDHNSVAIYRFLGAHDVLTGRASSETINAIDLLEQSLDNAKRMGDAMRVASIEKAISELKKTETASALLKIDWEKIQANQTERDKTILEIAFLEAVLSAGDTATREARKPILTRVTGLQASLLNLRKRIQTSGDGGEEEDEKGISEKFQKENEELQKLRVELTKELRSAESKKIQDMRKKLEKHLTKLKLKLQSIKADGAELSYASLIISSVGGREEYFKDSLRDIRQRAKKVKDRISFVEKVIHEVPDDYEFPRAELGRLLGNTFMGLSVVNELFKDTEKNADGTDVEPASGKPAITIKDTLSKEKAINAFNLWKDITKEDVHDESIDLEEASRIEELILAGERKIITEIGPEDTQPAARSSNHTVETTEVGKQYDAQSKESLVGLTSDLLGVLGRINTMTTLSHFNGVIPEWALVSILGSNSQSLFRLFDKAAINPLELISSVDDEYMDDETAKSVFLSETLKNLGFSDNEINVMPEADMDSFLSDFRTIVSIHAGIDPKTGEITHVILVPMNNGTPRAPIRISPSNGKQFSDVEAENILKDLKKYQDSGFKLTGHNLLGRDGTLQKLTTSSKKTQLAMSVGIRSYDTALLAFRGGPTSSFTRNNLPTLHNLTQSYYSPTFSSLKTTEESNSLLESGQEEAYLLDLEAKAVANAYVLMGMVQKSNATVEVAGGSPGHETKQQIKTGEIVPLWYDNSNPGQGTHRNYRGVQSMFDMQPFQNLKDANGTNIGKPNQYDLNQVQSVVLNLLVRVISETNPTELDNVMNGLLAAPGDLDEHYDLVMRLSKADHQGYMSLKRKKREANGNRFILDQGKASGPSNKVLTEFSSDPSDYIKVVLSSFLDTFKTYHRNAPRAIQKFARLVGIRDMNTDEGINDYISFVFRESNKIFNEQDLEFLDFGNGKYDYVSAKQLGRGFAQVILGFIKDGNTLTQNIDTPLNEVSKTREELESQGRKLDIQNIAGNETKRSYLPINVSNVSFFSPLSRFEQERIYNDWVLRKRYAFILNKELTEEDMVNFREFQATNKDTEFKNNILVIRAHLDALRKQLKNSRSKEASADIKEDIAKLGHQLYSLKEDFKAFRKARDDARLPQGRVQLYDILNHGNNRDPYTKIPTADEALTMSLEIAMELPQFVGSFVHDSTTRAAGQSGFLLAPTYLEAPGLSYGGPVGNASWGGLASLLAHVINNPLEFTADIETNVSGKKILKSFNLSKDILAAALNEYREARAKGIEFSDATYWDDKSSAIHHLAILQHAHTPTNKDFLGMLINIKNGGKSAFRDKDGVKILDANGKGMVVSTDELIDYYNEGFDTFMDSLPLIRKAIISKTSRWDSKDRAADLESLDRLEAILNDPKTKETRELFKGVILPVVYSAGYAGVMEDLRKRQKSDPSDPIATLTENDLSVIAQAMVKTAAVVQGRLVDKALGVDPESAALLADLMTSASNELKTEYRIDTTNLAKSSDDNLKNNRVTDEVLRRAILARIKQVARLSVKQVSISVMAQEKGISKEEAKEILVAKLTKELETKWSKRVDDAMALIKKDREDNNNPNSTVAYEIGSALERDVMVALAGGDEQWKTQGTLLFLNKAANSGLKMNTSEEALLEAQVKTGRHISRSDLMFQNHVVFHSMGFGSNTDRALYPGNYLTNLQGSDLSKGYRISRKADGSLDWDDTILNSMWSLTNNPLEKMSDSDARLTAEKLAAKNYALQLATNYEPSFLGYDIAEESREKFFEDWDKRSIEERSFDTSNMGPGSPMRQAYRDMERRQQLELGVKEENIKISTDLEIDAAIASNSTPFASRMGTRVLAPKVNRSKTDNLMTTTDAKGLGGFIPRIADHDILDAGVHGLYSIFIGSKRMRTKAGRFKSIVNKAKNDEAPVSEILDQAKGRASVYDPSQMPYVPEHNNSLTELLMGGEPNLLIKTNQLRVVLDRFAMESGNMDLVVAKNYGRLYMIYKLDRKHKKYLASLNQSGENKRNIQMAHRTHVLDIWGLTKFQRDMNNKESNLVDFRQSMMIDPSVFKYEDGSNMRWLDALTKMGQMGIAELSTLKFGIAPTEHQITGLDGLVSVLKDKSTMIKTLGVQGLDVSALILTVLSDDSIKRQATLEAEKMVKEGLLEKFSVDAQGFIILTSIEKGMDAILLERLFQDPVLLDSAPDILNLYVSIEIVAGENQLVFEQSVTHKETDASYVMPVPGVGTTVNRAKVGSQLVKFLFTHEAVKRTLLAARNAPFLRRMETAIAMDKTLGTSTNVDKLRNSSYADNHDKMLQELAEEAEILSYLHGPDPDNKLSLLIKDGESELRDELGLDLNPYDAEFYFSDRGVSSGKINESYYGMSAYETMIMSPMRAAIIAGKPYPAMNDDVKLLMDFYKSGSREVLPVGFLIQLKTNVKEISREKQMILLAELAGVSEMTDAEFDAIEAQADKFLAIIDKIKYSPLKGKNPYLAAAFKALDGEPHMELSYAFARIADIHHNPRPLAEGRLFADRNHLPTGAPNSVVLEDKDLKVQAIAEAKGLLRRLDLYPTERFEAAESEDTMMACHNGEDLKTLFGAEGEKISNQIDVLINTGTISEEVAVFYRFMVVRMLKQNPNLAGLLSIRTDASHSKFAGSAVKEGDRYIIRINTNITKGFGTVDQVRVFAHEMGHVARMAFIKDDSLEWRRIESLLRSSKGRETIRTMLIAVNNGSKYVGIEEDIRYYTDNPEEFAAQWGSWALMNKVFNDPQLMKMMRKNRGAAATSRAWQKAYRNIEGEIAGIAVGLSNIDQTILQDIFNMVEDMFGFTSTVNREIFAGNQDRTLYLNVDLDPALTSMERVELASLQKKKVLGLLNTVESTRYGELNLKYKTYAIAGMNEAQYEDLRGRRELEQTNPSSVSPGKRVSGELSPLQKAEIVQTLLVEGVNRAGTMSRSNTTMGGLSRNMSIKMFGKATTDSLTRGLSIMGHMGLTGATHTHGASEPILAVLMHIIGDTFSTTQHQFQSSEGSAGLRENRVYAKAMVDRVQHETDNLRMACRGTEFEEASKYAFKTALGITTTMPSTLPPKIQAMASELAITLSANGRMLRDFIMGSGGMFFENVPTQFSVSKIGTSTVQVSAKSKKAQAENRIKLRKALTELVKENIDKSDVVDGTVIYVTGLIPRLHSLSTQENIVEEMDRLKKELPKAYDVFYELMVARLIRQGRNASEARVFLNSTLSTPQLLVPGSNFKHGGDEREVLTLIKELSIEAYTHAGQQRSVGGMLNKLGANSLVPKFQDELRRVVKTTDSTNIGMGLFNDSTLLPPTVQIGAKSSVFQDGNSTVKNGSVAEILGSVYMRALGEDAEFMPNTGVITGKDMVNNPAVSEFMEHTCHVKMFDIERQQGFTAASKHAVFKATGIAGIGIVDLIEIVKAHLEDIEVQNPKKDRIQLGVSLNVILEKLNIERGLGTSEFASLPSFTQVMIKYGPDVIRLAHGSNLNTASLMMEGALGAYVTVAYGGDVGKFVGTVLSSFLGTYWGKNFTRLEQRGVAVNLMLGLERGMLDARDNINIADMTFDPNAGRYQKIRDWLRQNNNRGYQSVLNGLTQQAQIIACKGLRNGDLKKLRAIFRTGQIHSDSELREAMKIAGIKKINSHLALLLNEAGMFKGNTIEIYTWALANISSDEVKDGTLDLQAAQRWAERMDWDNPAELRKAGVTFTKDEMYSMTGSVYAFNKSFREIVVVDPNAWDSMTGSAFFGLFTIYKQYPHLYFSQKVMRLGGRMDWKIHMGMMLMGSIIDLLYNCMLLVATGAIPLMALNPLDDKFIFKGDNKVKILKMILGRNPVFGAMINNTLGAALAGYDKYDRTPKSRGTSETARIQHGIGAFFDDLLLQGVGFSAAETLVKGPLSAGYIATTQVAAWMTSGSVGGNTNSQEMWDQKKAIVSSFGRMIPGVSELPIRMLHHYLAGTESDKKVVRSAMQPTGSKNAFGIKDKVEDQPTSGTSKPHKTRLAPAPVLRQQENRATNPSRPPIGLR